MVIFIPELDKSSSDVAAEGAILNEMLEIVAKRAALRPSDPPGTSSSNFEVSLDDDLHAVVNSDTNTNTVDINTVVYSSLLITVVSILLYYHISS